MSNMRSLRRRTGRNLFRRGIKPMLPGLIAAHDRATGLRTVKAVGLCCLVAVALAWLCLSMSGCSIAHNIKLQSGLEEQRRETLRQIVEEENAAIGRNRRALASEDDAQARMQLEAENRSSLDRIRGFEVDVGTWDAIKEDPWGHAWRAVLDLAGGYVGGTVLMNTVDKLNDSDEGGDTYTAGRDINQNSPVDNRSEPAPEEEPEEEAP